ncbi:MAG: DUF3566 domain-containing protein [Actinomycetota bacterium]|nr:DUF3566 domain-containing protein [Actinomycetota bacterium]
MQEGGAPAPPGGRQGLAPGPTVAASSYPRGWRRARLVIRKVDPWSVLRFSLLFYFCLLLIVLLGSAIIFAILKAFGVVANVEQLFASLEIKVKISGGAIFKWLFLVGVLGTIVWTAVSVFAAFLYNLIADVVGGIEVSVSEKD